MQLKESVKIIDVTVPKGGALIHNRLLKEQVAEIAKGLEESGVEFMEISHSRGIGSKRAGYPALFSDRELLIEARFSAPKLKYTAYLSPHPYSLFEIEKIEEYCDWFRMSIDFENVPKSIETVTATNKSGKKIMALLERAHRFSPEQIGDLAKKLQDSGAQVIYLCDTFSSLSPDETRKYLEAIKKKVALPIGFQACNGTGQAIANCLASLETGANWLDGSLLGLGLSGGMAPLETLISVLQCMGQQKKTNLRRLCRIARWFALPVARHLPLTHHIDFLMSDAKLDYYPAEILEMLANILDLPLKDFLKELAEVRTEIIRLKESDVRDLLKKHSLDFDVVMEFIKTGKIASLASTA